MDEGRKSGMKGKGEGVGEGVRGTDGGMVAEVMVEEVMVEEVMVGRLWKYFRCKFFLIFSSLVLSIQFEELFCVRI